MSLPVSITSAGFYLTTTFYPWRGVGSGARHRLLHARSRRNRSNLLEEKRSRFIVTDTKEEKPRVPHENRAIILKTRSPPVESLLHRHRSSACIHVFKLGLAVPAAAQLGLYFNQPPAFQAASKAASAWRSEGRATP
ncbi:hypothetical protein AALO_G00113770 [Alosa alosa]|uniref:Uncharacterized protein n=1 Tax=Alosa alosa TaxID=278164 RepID=A0AAV6GPT3_9TELE|nr:hypothetical protein AALO_G00113770 [Alosa alosa]